MAVIGITGSLASGKSTVASVFGRCGAVIFNADTIAHRALFRNTQCYEKLIKRFGSVILDRRGLINRKKLAAAGFADKKSERDLCAIIHPWVFAYLDKHIGVCQKKCPRKAIVVDAALLIESGLYRRMDAVIVVRSTLAQQKRRAAAGRNMTAEQFQERVRFQIPFGEKIKHADYVIDNRGALRDTESQVRKLCKQLNIRKVYGNK